MGLVLRNIETGQDEDIPAEAVPHTILSGKYGAPAGTRIPVQFADGGFGEVPIEHVYEQFRRGAEYDPPEAQAERAREREFGGRGAEAFGLGVGSAVGLPWFLKQTGMVQPRTMAGIVEKNPLAHTLGEVAGWVGPVLATGGTSTLAKGAAEVAGKVAARSGVRGALALTPPALVAKAGRAVEGAAEHLLSPLGKAAEGGLARHVAAQIVPKMAGGAAEGWAFGGAQALDESALGDTDLVGEQFLANANKMALYGAAGVGALAGGAKLVGNALRPVLTRATERFDSATIGKWFKDAAGDLSLGSLMGRRKGEIKKLLNNPEREAALKAMARDEVLPRVGKTADISELAEGAQKNVADYGEKLGKMYDDLDAMATPEGLVYRKKVPVGDLKDIVAEPFDPQRTAAVNAAFDAGEALPPIRVVIREDGARVLEDGQHRLAQARARGLKEIEVEWRDTRPIGQNRVNTYEVAQDLRRQAAEAAKLSGADAQSKARFLRGQADTVEGLGGVAPTAKELRAAKEAVAHYKEAAASATEAARKARTLAAGEYASVKELAAADKAEAGAAKLWERVSREDDALASLEARQQAVRNNTISFREYQAQRASAAPPNSKYNIAEPSWSVEGKTDVASTWNRLADAKAEPLAKAAGMEQSFRELRRKYSLASQLNEFAQDRLAAATGNRRFPLTSVLSGIGGAAAGNAGAAASAAQGLVTAEATRWVLARGQLMAAKAADAVAEKLAKLRVIQVQAGKTAKRTSDAVDSFLDAAKRAPRAAVPVSVHVLSESRLEGGPKIKNRAEAYAARTAEVRVLASNEPLLAQRMAHGFAHMNDAAPKISARAQMSAAANMAYLSSLIYKNPHSDNQLLAHLDPPATPEWAQAEWMRVYAAFDDPAKVLEEWAGGTFNPEGYAYLERFYPAVIADFKLKLTEKLVTLEKPLDYRFRLRLTQIGILADPTARPDVYGAVQASFVAPQAQGGGGGRPAGRSAQGEAARTHVDRLAVGGR